MSESCERKLRVAAVPVLLLFSNFLYIYIYICLFVCVLVSLKEL